MKVVAVVPRARGQEMVPPFGESDVSPVIACTAEEDMARQEYKLQSDLKYQVARFGAGLPFQAGELNTDMDLTQAFALIEESQQRWLTLPAVIRDRYRSWANVEAAAASGELEQVLKAAGVGGAAVAPAKPVASPSDSAAGVKADA